MYVCCFSHVDLRGMPPRIIKLMETQPTLNLMTLGHVSHGKSTLMYALSKERTGRHLKEKERNQTIKLGYTQNKVFKCLRCYPPHCYFPASSKMRTKEVECPNCKSLGRNGQVILVRHLSFVDCPGHASLMGTMISAACVADGALMVIASNAKCPEAQTLQHANAAHLLGVLTNTYSPLDGGEREEKKEKRHKVLVAQNKIDLSTPQKASLQHNQIQSFLRAYGKDIAVNTPIIPISAQSEYNIDAFCMYITQHLPMYSPRLSESQLRKPLRMNIIRSFDVNKPQTFSNADEFKNLKGGVIGSVILSGALKKGEVVEIRPGIIRRVAGSSKFMVSPVQSRVVSISCGTTRLESANAGKYSSLFYLRFPAIYVCLFSII